MQSQAKPSFGVSVNCDTEAKGQGFVAHPQSVTENTNCQASLAEVTSTTQWESSGNGCRCEYLASTPAQAGDCAHHPSP